MSNVSRPARKTPARREPDESPQAAIGHLLKHMHQSLRQAVDESLRRERIDVSFAHFVTLVTLASEPGIAGAELARRSFVTAQTMNTILRRLEREGAIERRPHPTNQRADSWYLSKAGQSSLVKAQVVVERVWSGMFEDLSDPEVRQLQRLLERCLMGLDRQVNALRHAKSARKQPQRRK